jgi:phosphate/sulfate permease
VTLPPCAAREPRFIILVALAFDYINGFHDAANSIATVVSTRVLAPMPAVVWAALFYSLGHGTNDAQRTMGITLAGGWRIVKTMGMRLTKLRRVGSLCAETAGAIMLIGTAVGGIPMSTTPTITGSIMGVGATQRLSAVRWGLAGRILWAWILTIPLSALLAGLTWLLLPHG